MAGATETMCFLHRKRRIRNVKLYKRVYNIDIIICIYPLAYHDWGGEKLIFKSRLYILGSFICSAINYTHYAC